MIVTGLYVGYYGVYELRVFFAGAPTSDPIVDGAGAVQGVLAGWVDGLGVLPFAIAVAALVAGSGAGVIPRSASSGPSTSLRPHPPSQDLRPMPDLTGILTGTDACER